MRTAKVTWIAGLLVGCFVLIAIFAPFIAGDASPGSLFPIIKFGPETFDILSSQIFSAPDSTHLFGTDYVGRDVFARLVYAIRNSLFFSFAVVTVCALTGAFLGGLMGFFGGKVDIILSRIVEVIANFPTFLHASSFFPPSYGILLFVMVITGWISYTAIYSG